VISNILDVSRIEAGEIELQLAPVQVSELVEQAITVCRPIVERSNNRLAVRIDPNAGVVYTDATKVRQILLNLVGNAAGHTRNGSITVRARRIRTDHDWLQIEVSDTGEGIPPDALPRLFEPFERGDSPGARGRDGAGLGLAICRGLSRLLGGDCTAASVPGSGSTFTARVRAG
jgi:signal transduction histidine kinase